MELRTLIGDTITFNHQRIVKATKDLTPAQLHWQPTPDTNHIGFLMFHTFRVLDQHFHRQLSLQGELWERNKWGRHFALPPAPPNVRPAWSTGNSWTSVEVASFQVPPIDQLLAYGDSVYQSAMRKLETLDLSDLSRTSTEPGSTATVGSVLYRTTTHLPQHAGQIEYLVGMLQRKAA
ncbi:MAG: DinB family protein [Dehalococcoidia bacterium]|nr:DinB family protein [Dehalococcoidia bacterium]